MPDIVTWGELFEKYGMTFILTTYFLVKDWVQTKEIISMLGSIREVLVELKTWHSKEESEQ